MISSGTSLGRYQVRTRLGAGGMGEVYLAFDPELERVVAIKLLAEELAGDADRLSRFVREAKAASALNHPNILTVHDFGSDGATRFLVTEYVDGRTLRRWLADERPALDDVLDVVAQAATALETAHAAGIVHRDVKPENLMLRRDGLVKVLDFGIAKLMTLTERETEGPSPDLSQTLPGTILGTVRYMSPEQARGAPVDARADVWSLGVVLYELVAGRLPFAGKTRMATIAAILEREPEPLDHAAPGAPEPLCRLVERALRKPAAERLGSAGELAAELRRIKSELEQYAVTITDRPEPRATAETQLRDDPERPTNLPPRTSSLVGRERELHAIVSELRAARLVTLTGPGGTGKTRLALEAGRAMAPELEHGVFFVDLVAIRAPELVVSAVARALGVQESAGAPLDETLAQFLAERELLLVLDNFEQVVAAAPIVALLLSRAPRLKALATSRERLHLSVEREFALSPLALPPADGGATGKDLECYGAVALFVERARAVRPGFALAALGESNRTAVAEICRRLDGLPLAIELAAARLRMLTPEALLARLDPQLRLLTGGSRDLPERQQTMRAAIAWSYDLLDDAERRLFERLSVFSGGWTLAAAESVVSRNLSPTTDVLDLLTQLVDKSLVVVEERGEEMRYRMLETIRQFAAEKLREAGDEALVRTAHAAWLVELAEAGADAFKGPGKVRWLARLDRELENVRAALEWSEGEGDARDVALRLCAAVGIYWESRGLWSEGRSRLERALAGDRTSSPARAAALVSAGTLARYQSEFERARELVTEGLAIYREHGDRAGAGMALGWLATIVHHLGDLDAADTMLREALAQYDGADDARVRARLLVSLGSVAYDRKAFDEAATYNEEALALYREIGDRSQVAIELYNLGVLAERRGDLDRATELLEESLALTREIDYRPLGARVIHYFGKIAGGQGDYGRAAALRAEASEIYLAVGDRHMLRFMFEEVTEEALARGLAERAARLLGATMRLVDSGELSRPAPGDTQHSDILAAVRNALGEAEADLAVTKGRALTLQQALKVAFDG